MDAVESIEQSESTSRTHRSLSVSVSITLASYVSFWLGLLPGGYATLVFWLVVFLWLAYAGRALFSVIRSHWARTDDEPPCMKCGYNLKGNVTGVCSECGTKIAPSTADLFPRALHLAERMAIIFLGIVFVLFMSFITELGFLPNLGFPFGYYGELNQVRSALEDLDNVQIKKVRMNRDLSLEDFSFELTVANRYRLRISFDNRKPPTALLQEAKRLVYRRQVEVSSSGGTEERIWVLHLGPDGDLKRADGTPLRNVQDIVAAFDVVERAMGRVSSLGPDDLDAHEALGYGRATDVRIREIAFYGHSRTFK